MKIRHMDYPQELLADLYSSMMKTKITIINDIDTKELQEAISFTRLMYLSYDQTDELCRKHNIDKRTINDAQTDIFQLFMGVFGGSYLNYHIVNS